jgi:hypothetical protein
MINISRRQACRLLYEHKESGSSSMFAVTFIKRTTGEERTMLARFGVKSFLKGGTLAFDPEDYNLMTVFDMDKQAYRSINMEGLLSLSMGGQRYKVTSL